MEATCVLAGIFIVLLRVVGRLLLALPGRAVRRTYFAEARPTDRRATARASGTGAHRLPGLDLRGSRGIVAGSGAARPFVADADADRAPAPDSGRGMGMIFETRSGNLLEKITPGAHGAGHEWGFSSGAKIEKVYRGISIGCTPCKAWLGRACARTSSAATLGRSIGAGSVVF